MLRLFVAVDLPPAIKSELALLPDRVSKWVKNVKWVASENIHLTLKFLGNSPAELVPRIEEQLSKKVHKVQSFPLELCRVGAFPRVKKARVLWLGVEKGADELLTLQRKIEKPLAVLGFETEKRKYHAHLTLARLRAPRDLSTAVAVLENEKILFKLVVEKVTLFQSTLTPKGPIYTPLAEFPLKSR